MRISILLALLLQLASVPPGAARGALAPVASTDAADVPPRASAVLIAIRAADKGQLAVSEEDGRFLRLLTASNKTRHALEIGTASGYSAIWIGLGLRVSGGRLTTVEYDPTRAREARENIRRAGLEDIVTVVAGDGFAEIPRIAGTFDLVFLDAWKRDYRRFFDLVLPRLDRGGLFLAHNVLNKGSEMTDFLTAIRTGPHLLTSIVAPSGEGISVTYKVR